MNTWVIGDIHNAYKALKQVFDRTPLEEGDTIISLGDIVDGWSQAYECVDFLIQAKSKYNMIFLQGNHDEWFNCWLQDLCNDHPGVTQGGRATMISYADKLKCPWFDTYVGLRTSLRPMFIPDNHKQFFANQQLYYLDSQNRLFVHGGFDRNYSREVLERDEPSSFYWDRELWNKALSAESYNQDKINTIEDYKEIFIGHTTTLMWGKNTPMKAANVWNLDTGAGGSKGKLTMMNVDTKEYYQSDIVGELYNKEKGRF